MEVGENQILKSDLPTKISILFFVCLISARLLRPELLIFSMLSAYYVTQTIFPRQKLLRLKLVVRKKGGKLETELMDGTSIKHVHMSVWCSGYHIRLTRGRPSVQSRPLICFARTYHTRFEEKRKSFHGFNKSLGFFLCGLKGFWTWYSMTIGIRNALAH